MKTIIIVWVIYFIGVIVAFLINFFALRKIGDGELSLGDFILITFSSILSWVMVIPGIVSLCDEILVFKKKKEKQ